MVQREASAVRVDAAEEHVCCFGVVECFVVQERCGHSCYRDARRQTLDEIPEDVYLVPSDVVWSSADEAVEIAAARYGQDL